MVQIVVILQNEDCSRRHEGTTELHKDYLVVLEGN